MTEWQPIETAPRGKTPILVCTRDGEIAVAHSFGDDSWIIDNSFGFNEDGEIYDVTHWMHLPSPPVAERAAAIQRSLSQVNELIENIEALRKMLLHRRA